MASDVHLGVAETVTARFETFYEDFGVCRRFGTYFFGIRPLSPKEMEISFLDCS